MIATFLITVLTEGIVVIGYSAWRKKPAAALLITSTCANLLTQSMLWVILSIFFHHYLWALATGEVLVWGIETLLLFIIPANKLSLLEAALLSLGMNLMSLTTGWFLPV